VEPIGTITNYFPYLDEETIDVLKVIMEEASNYYDFVVRLGNMACDEDVSIELVYIATMHVYLARERKLQEKLREKFKDRPEIVAWTFPMLGPSDIKYRDEVHSVLSRAIETNPPDWLLINLYLLIENWFIRTSSELVELIKKSRIYSRSQSNFCMF
jgi:hypothetical protein